MIRLLAPAKINLGLEILGKRPDGYHEIRTMLAAVSLFDRIEIVPAELSTFTCDRPVLLEDNLVRAAMKLLPRVSARVSLRKRIPLAAGLGGASSDAAATLAGLDRLFDLNLGRAHLHELAMTLGSDVPFFLDGGIALARGRGERLTRIERVFVFWAVIVTPAGSLANKTAAMYRALHSTDFSSGDEVEQLARMLPEIPDLSAQQLHNAFSGPLLRLRPELAELPVLMRRCGASGAHLSGAGPSHFSIEPDVERAHRLAQRLRAELGRHAAVHVCRSIASGSLLENNAAPTLCI